MATQTQELAEVLDIFKRHTVWQDDGEREKVEKFIDSLSDDSGDDQDDDGKADAAENDGNGDDGPKTPDPADAPDDQKMTVKATPATTAPKRRN